MNSSSKTVRKSNLILSKMANQEKEIELLKRALARQKKARLAAEQILEKKSKELYDVTRHLQEANSKLENLLTEKTSELDGVFINIIDPYVVMDMNFNVVNMNSSAKQFLGYDHTREKVNLSQLVLEDFMEYTVESMNSLLQVGVLNNYRAKIRIKDKTIKWVEINSSLIYDSNRKPIAAQGIVRDITKEMEIKQLLSEQKRQLDIIVENSPLGVILVYEDRFIKANTAFCNLTGYQEHELKKLSLSEITVAEDKNITKDYILKMRRGEIDNFTVNKRYLRKDGTILYARLLVSAVRNIDGIEDYQVAIVEDIRKEMEAEQQLKASENRLSTLILNLQTGVLLEDENGKIQLTNQMFCDLFQIPATPEQMVGADCSASAEQSKGMFKDSKNFIRRIDTILANKKTVLSEELEMVDGRVLERDYIPIFNEGVYKGHLWSYHDVTLKKNYEATLSAEREKYGSIIANMNLGLLEVDNNDIIQLVNQSFCEMSGFTENELLGKRASEVLRVKEKEMILSKEQKRLNGESDSFEVRILDKSGALRYWLISGTPRVDKHNKVIGSIGIHLDITKQKVLELQKEQLMKELESSNQGLQEYAHIVSHDLKSPLRSISALSNWLQEDYKDVLDETGNHHLQMMQEKVGSMDKLISGILEYSTANSSNLDNTPVDLNTIIENIKETIYIPDHVKLSVPKPLPILMADRTKMHQLFQNILSNAVVHIEKEEGLVEVFCKEEPGQWRFTIADNGVGIPEKHHKKIFEIFQSVGNKERSTGIGLSIVKKIVDRYHGEVWVESEVGIGTQFHFTLKKQIDA